MRMSWILALMSTLAACGGGGGGGGTTPPVTTSASLMAKAVEIPPAADGADITLSLTRGPDPAPVLLEAQIVLPAQLSLPADDRLTPATPLITLDGNFVDDAFVVVAGDATNQDAQPLPNGDLFRLRVTPTEPRTAGTYSVTIRDLRAATLEGDAVPLESETLSVDVTIR